MTQVDDLVEDIADEDTKSILTDDADKDIQSNIYDDACGATWWPNFVLMQEFPTNACGATCCLNLLAIRYLQLWCHPMGPWLVHCCIPVSLLIGG